MIATDKIFNIAQRGRAWVFGDDIDTDLIIQARYLSASSMGDLARHALELLAPQFASEVRPGDWIVAGENWGCGSAREQAVLVLKQLGVAGVVCVSAARIFYRNALNNGFPVIEGSALYKEVQTGEDIEIDLGQGQIRRLSTERVFPIRSIPEFMLRILAAGGLLPFLADPNSSCYLG